MAELKTKPTTASVTDFLESVADQERRNDCLAIAQIMEKVTGAKPRMWGPSIIGFGDYRYKGASGETDWFLTGFSPRKKELTLYIMPGVERFPGQLAKLGKYKTGKSCLYIKRLADVDAKVLTMLIEESVKTMTGKR
jgi:uncharacterized protein DUF1801